MIPGAVTSYRSSSLLCVKHVCSSGRPLTPDRYQSKHSHLRLRPPLPTHLCFQVHLHTPTPEGHKGSRGHNTPVVAARPCSRGLGTDLRPAFPLRRSCSQTCLQDNLEECPSGSEGLFVGCFVSGHSQTTARPEETPLGVLACPSEMLLFMGDFLSILPSFQSSKRNREQELIANVLESTETTSKWIKGKEEERML